MQYKELLPISLSFALVSLLTSTPQAESARAKLTRTASSPTQKLARVDFTSSLSSQATKAALAGRVDEASDLVTKALAQNPDDWLAHGTLSYLMFEQGNVVEALEHGEAAAKINPGNAQLLSNMGALYEGFDDCEKAMPWYRKAIAVAPQRWQAQLGLARCLVKTGKEKDALVLLQNMSAGKSSDINCYLELADIAYQMDKANLSASAASRALKLASTPEQKAKAQVACFLGRLKDNQVAEANQVKDAAFAASAKDYELYVRALAALIPAEDPAAGKALIEAARTNLQERDDSIGFFKLGRLAYEKAQSVKSDADKHRAWLEQAQSAFSQAVAFHPMIGRYHLALGTVAAELGQSSKAKEEWQAAQAIDKGDELPAYLQSTLDNNQPVRLLHVKFQPRGLHCGCHVSKLLLALTKVKGIAFAHVQGNAPFAGTLLVDDSVANLQELLDSGLEKAKTELSMPATNVSMVIAGTEPVQSIYGALSIAQSVQDGDTLHFTTAFKPVKPELPQIKPVATASKTAGKVL